MGSINMCLSYSNALPEVFLAGNRFRRDTGPGSARSHLFRKELMEKR